MLEDPVFRARFNGGQCATCAGRIYKGDAVRWRKGQGTRHADCLPRAAAPKKKIR